MAVYGRVCQKIYQGVSAAGVDYMEIGYLSSECAFSRDEVGPWKFCAESDLRRIIGDEEKKIKLSAMADIGRIEYADIPPKNESSLDIGPRRLLRSPDRQGDCTGSPLHGQGI